MYNNKNIDIYIRPLWSLYKGCKGFK